MALSFKMPQTPLPLFDVYKTDVLCVQIDNIDVPKIQILQKSPFDSSTRQDRCSFCST